MTESPHFDGRKINDQNDINHVDCDSLAVNTRKI